MFCQRKEKKKFSLLLLWGCVIVFDNNFMYHFCYVVNKFSLLKRKYYFILITKIKNQSNKGMIKKIVFQTFSKIQGINFLVANKKIEKKLLLYFFFLEKN